MPIPQPDRMEPNEDFDDKEAAARLKAFVASLPKPLEEREDKFLRKIALDNASARSRLRKLHNFTDEVMKHARPYVACKEGCSHCCRMNVTISKLEAEHIERETGRKAVALSDSVPHRQGEFNGVLCPFLKDDACSIYPVRPYVCRKHVSFAETNFWCHPDRNLKAKMPMVEFSGLEDAFTAITLRRAGGVLADIRDFFPTKT